MIDTNKVSVIMPIFNEEKHIAKALECMVNQDWQDHIEIVIVDGNSTDDSVKIIKEFEKGLPENRSIKLLYNSKRYIPISLNIACENVSNFIIVRIDGHTYAPLNYVSESVKALKSIDFKGIAGGICKIGAENDSVLAKSIALAVSHKVGVGNAQYRTFNGDVNTYIEVDTVPFGAFTKEIWEDIGGYDEKLLYDEDYDFNFKARKNGYKVLMNPKIVLNYFSRKNLRLLWKQYYRYGYWANKFCFKHKIIPSLRRLIPLCFVTSFIIAPIISVKLLYLLIIAYCLCIAAVSFSEGLIKRKSLKMFLCLLPTFPTLHFSYGIGSLFSVITETKHIFNKK